MVAGVLPRVGGVLPTVAGVLPKVGGVLPTCWGVLPRVAGVLPSVWGVLPEMELCRWRRRGAPDRGALAAIIGGAAGGARQWSHFPSQFE
jgi:hypothetical protein